MLGRNPAPRDRSIRPTSSFSFWRNRASSMAISPLSRSWSNPARWRMPWSTRIFTSSAREWPRWLAFSRAMSSDMASSPATRLPGPPIAGVDGKDNTSVLLSLPQNRRFNARRSRLLVSKTFTLSRKRTACRARRTKRSRVDGLNPATLFRRITNLPAPTNRPTPSGGRLL